ncbi:MAG: hypothetical protein GXP27_21075 [Planctomycetes bacterium]|nr:hypothetical protein [Planctomycetota bacterium]
MKGTLVRRPDGYAIRTPHGEVIYSTDQVLCEASSLRDAYQKLRRSIPHPTAAQHTALARWCLLHELYEEARRELMAALGQNPDHQTAREMLRKLDSVLGRTEIRPLDSSGALVEQAREQLEARALGGLPRELARQYAETIQPLLLNKCAAGACHGPYEQRSFRLIRLRPSRSHRVFAEQNLATVLRFLDREKPNQSPLLVRCTDGHDGRPRELFAGPAGRQQLLRLRKWVAAVTAAMTSDSQAGASPFELLTSQEATATEPAGINRESSPIPGVPRTSSLSAPIEPTVPIASASGDSASRLAEPTKAASPFPTPRARRTTNTAPRHAASDPFDPERFNRRRPTTSGRK